MGILPHAELLKLHEAALSASLVESRDALLTGIDRGFAAALPAAATPAAQLLRDLGTLNDAGPLSDGTVPLLIWLANAARLASPRADAHVFQLAIEHYQTRTATSRDASTLRQDGIPCDDAGPNARKRERLISNLLKVTGVGPRLWLADSKFAKPEEVFGALAKATEDIPREWVLHEKRLYSLRDLEDDCWRDVCVSSTIRSTHAASWSIDADADRRTVARHLLRRALEARLWPDMKYRKDVDCYAFEATADLSPRAISYNSAHRRSSATVFKGYGTKGKTAYYRHLGFGARFKIFEDDWYLEITPTYVFTSDGQHLYRYHEDRLQDIKRMERNRAVRQQVFLLADYVRGYEDLFTRRYPFLSFGPLLEFDIDVGIDDNLWMPQESDEASFQLSFVDP